MGLLQQLLQNARRPTKMTLELVEFWHFRTPPSDRFPIRKRSAWALRKAKWRIGSGTGIRTLNLAVNRSLRPVQKLRPEFTECRLALLFATICYRRCCTASAVCQPGPSLKD